LQPRQKRLDAIDAGKDQPIIAFDFFCRGIESGKALRRLNFDRRKLYDFAAQCFDAARQTFRLSARPRHHDSFTDQRFMWRLFALSVSFARHLNICEQLARASFQKLLR